MEMWIADRNIYLNAEGGVVAKGDKSAEKLLVCAGGGIPMSEATRLGLDVPDDGIGAGSKPAAEPALEFELAEAKAIDAPPATKAVTTKRVK